MSGFNVTIESNNTSEVLGSLSDGIERALEAIGAQVENYAKINLTENGSVDTGNLRNSVTHVVEASEESVYIGSAVEYAAYVQQVELGTSRSKAKPYLEPAVMDHIDEYQQIVEDALKGFSD